MADLHVALEDGFDADHVVVQLDGDTVFDEPSISTRHQIGLAATVDAPASSPARLQVSLPERGLAAELPVDPTTTPYVRVSVLDGTVQIASSDEPPLYA
jgi:hypothetical protein